MLNKVMAIGNLGKDPELREGKHGKFTTFSIACTERWKSKDGTKQEKTEWLNVLVSGPQAESAAKYLKKGSKVFVEGRLRTTKQDEKYFTSVVGNVTFLDTKPKTEQSPEETYEDDIPF